MLWKRSIIVFMLLTLSLFLAGCELSLQDTEVQDIDAVPVVTTAATTASTPPTAEAPATTGETPVAGQPGEGEPTDESPRPETETPAAGETAETPATTEPSGEPAPVVTAEPVTEEVATTPAEQPAPTEQPATTEQPAPTSTAATTHTVAVGDNLYRIGLRYGVSWAVLAQHNNLPNANSIQVGQVLQIPATGQDDAAVAPTPTPVPGDGTTYTVRAGDTLARIGQAYNVDWRLIAEANGLLNPNRILVGDELKIPTNTPGPNPDLTHEVRTGETLFLISLNYGVTWTSIAEANDLISPYVIYPGQILTIPGE